MVKTMNITEYWYTQTVDHFNWRNTENFQQRFFVDDSNWITNGPIFMYTGNEAPIETFISNSGFIFEIAPDFAAMVIFAEHRYYGKSFPFGSDSFKPGKIDFLTVEQAMADFAELIVYIQTKSQWGQNAKDSPIIVFGGSYGANLAMWMRTKYPNLVAGAIASSATPLKHLLRESNAFWKIVTDVYANVSIDCPHYVRAGFDKLVENATTPSGRAYLSTVLGLCEPLPSQKSVDVVYNWITNGLETMVQYGYPYPTSFYNPLPGYPFIVACNAMVKAEEPLAALRAAMNVYYNWTGEAGRCYDIFSSNYNKINRVPPFNTYRYYSTAYDDNTDMAWSYQTCTEVYQPMPTNGITDMFLPYTPNDEEIFQNCNNTWGVVPRPDWEEMNFWGDRIITATNIFLTNGQLDPWRSAGIATCPKCGPSIIIRTMTNASHHLDLRASNDLDPTDVVSARTEEKIAISEWINEWSKYRLK